MLLGGFGLAAVLSNLILWSICILLVCLRLYVRGVIRLSELSVIVMAIFVTDASC